MKLIVLAVFLALFGCHLDSPEVIAQPKRPETTEKAEAKEKQRAPTPTKLKETDKGILSKFDGEVRINEPTWLGSAPTISVGREGHSAFVYVDGTAVGLSASKNIALSEFGSDDVDGDGIPNQLDILIGAKKADLNDAAYGSPYRKLDYPNGDVPLTEGVCTDVVVRALRNAGIDLQKELHEDIKRSPKSFPMVKRADPNIDQRRVKTMLPYFKRHWKSLPTTFKGHEHTWLPGDIVFMQTMGDKRPDHVGILSDKVGESGAPVIINNWTDGYSTDELDLVEWVPITHRFRWKSSPKLPDAWRGVSGVLAQNNLMLPPTAEQAIVVTSPSVTSTTATLRVVERQSDKSWKMTLGPYKVALGAAGLKRGVDLIPNNVPPSKKEGDLAAPWGVFAIGKAFGSLPPPKKTAWPYTQVTDDDQWVDDPSSEHYNRWVKRGDGRWKSAETLSAYKRALVIEHNTNFPRKGMGSAIFLHDWKDAKTPTLGCTALPRKKVDRILRVLDPKKKPVFIQAPATWF